LIDIVVHVEEGAAKVKVGLEKANNADLQAAICNLEMIKISLLKNLISMTDAHLSNGDDDDDDEIMCV